VQALPPAPHVAVAGVWQVDAVQHPSGQWQPLQEPESQVSPEGHGAQAAPAPPHWLLVLPGSHVVPLQHPVGHEVELHTHWPATHACPEVQAGPEPHWQLPEAPQPSLVVALHPVQMQAPPTQLFPGGQGSPPVQAAPRPL
jgi:hypothetical protein